MMFRIHNDEAIEKHGGYICGNDNFHIVQCTNCSCQYLYNDETIQLYHNPEDLKQVTFEMEGEDSPACRCCGKQKWDFEELNENDEQRVKAGDWAWLILE